MNKLSFCSLFLGLVLSATSFAQTHYYSFNVRSSGTGIYACNAGLRSQLNQQCDFCKQTMKDGTVKSVPRPPGCTEEETGCGHDIVCAHRDANSGGALLNYFTVSAGPVDSGPFAKRKVHGATTYTTLASEGSAFLNQMQDDLQFSLTNELYNAQYFVDICFHGTEIDTAKDGVDLRYELGAKAGSSQPNIPVAQRYTTVSGLKVQAFIICDFNPNSTAANNSALFTAGANGLPTNAAYTSQAIDVTTDMIGLVGATVLNPKFCKVRYVFTETKGLNCAAGATAFRDKGLKSAAICLETDFNEPQ